MDELIYVLIKLLAGLFGEGTKARPPQAPVAPRLLANQQQLNRQRMIQAPPRQAPASKSARKRMPAVPPPAAPSPQLLPPAAAQKSAPAPLLPRRASSGVDAAALRRWLRPQTLHSQFMLSEIFQPPVSMRE